MHIINCLNIYEKLTIFSFQRLEKSYAKSHLILNCVFLDLRKIIRN
jgi:hypothetical protein